jgi:dephospho-CoA kinase
MKGKRGMTAIGLTGNIGSGKSTVARIWKDKRGAMVVEADKLGKDAVAPGSEALAKLVAHFGEQILLPDGTLNRRRTAELAFVNNAERHALNSVVHPEIIRRIGLEMISARKAGVRSVVVDAALIFEFGFDNHLDVVVVVDAPRSCKIERMLAKGKMSRETIEQVMEIQMPPEEMRAKADYVLLNEGDLDALEIVALELYDRIVPPR